MGKNPRSHCNLMGTWEKMFYMSQKGKGSIRDCYAQNSRVIVPPCNLLGCLSPACPVLLWHPIAQRISLPIKTRLTRIIWSGSSFPWPESAQVIWRVNDAGLWNAAREGTTMQKLGNKQKWDGNSSALGRFFYKSTTRLWLATSIATGGWRGQSMNGSRKD